MVGLRRERAKREGTFLEGVKKLLTELKEEIASIKASVANISDRNGQVGNCMFSQGCNAELNECWNDWEAWSAIAAACDLHGIDCEADPHHKVLRAEAPPYVPVMNDFSISRMSLLQFREGMRCLDKPEELMNLKIDTVQTSKDISVVGRERLWKRKRPCAKVRRQRRLAQQLIPDEAGPSRCDECQDDGMTESGFESRDVPESHYGRSSAEVMPHQLPSDDCWEMILPVSSGTWLTNRRQSYPLQLQRAVFLSMLPVNHELFEDLELGFDTGSASRVDWKEEALCIDDPSTQGEGQTSLDRDEVSAIVSARQILDISMDYMLRYLEMDQRGVIPSHVHDRVLQLVKSTSCWMKQPLASQELQSKIEEHNMFMASIVSEMSTR